MTFNYFQKPASGKTILFKLALQHYIAKCRDTTFSLFGYRLNSISAAVPSSSVTSLLLG